MRIKLNGTSFSLHSRVIMVWCFTFIICAVKAQHDIKLINSAKSLQYGFSLRGLLEIGSRNSPNPVFRITANAGIGSDFLASNLYPTLNTEFHLYNGGLGSKNTGCILKTLSFDAILALTVTTGFRNDLTNNYAVQLLDRNMPMYYFGNFVAPALQNPFDYSVSVGTNLIFSPDDHKKNQRIGFANVHLRNFQVCYFNDGGPFFADLYLGDRADRYYTGGGLVSYNLPNQFAINNLELAYYKYTGYSRSAFEVSNKLYLDYMDYRDPVQKGYNKSLWTFGLSNKSRGWGLAIQSYNDVKWDLQHHIHTALFNAFHMVQQPPYFSLGFFKSYTLNTLGLK